MGTPSRLDAIWAHCVLSLVASPTYGGYPGSERPMGQSLGETRLRAAAIPSPDGPNQTAALPPLNWPCPSPAMIKFGRMGFNPNKTNETKLMADSVWN